MSIKNFNDIILNRTRDLPALAQCLNQLRHRVRLFLTLAKNIIF
jgi:hypothetical protein